MIDLSHPIAREGLLLLVILNPFAQMVYLANLIADTEDGEFRRIFLCASLLTAVICVLFALTGEFLLSHVFQVSLPAMQIFGGLVILGVAYTYIVRGPEGLRLFRGDITEIAQQVALPIMIGPGLIWMSIRVGRDFSPMTALTIITAVLAVNAACVLAYQWFYRKAKGPIEVALIKYFSIAMRLNALLIGAVSVQMILSGVTDYVGATE
jgi:multiple antibiotic resistance protein